MNRRRGEEKKLTFEMVMSAVANIAAGSSIRKEAARLGVPRSTLHVAIKPRATRKKK